MKRFSISSHSLLLVLAIFACSLNSGKLLAASDRPNVLFLICDDLNCDLGSYGHPLVKSPNIDKLARRGVLFKNAHCQYSLCGPSRASFMTGLYPDQTLVHRNAVYIREFIPNVQTMSQMFRKNGYLATRIGKIFHYNVPLHVGTGGHDDPNSWDHTINPRGRDMVELNMVNTLVPGQYGGALSWLAADGTDEEQTDGMIATEAVKILNQHAEDKQPFYLAVGMFRPHTPYVAPKKYFDMYPLDKIKVPKVPEGYFETIPEMAKTTLHAKKSQLNLDEATAKEVIQAYYASITFADAQVGKVLDALESTGLDKNTIVIFTSDHGYHMGEHDHYQKMTLYNNGTNVPLIVAGPGVKSVGKTSNAPVEMIDFYPTLAELSGLKPPQYLSGKSLKPILDDPSTQTRKAALTQIVRGAGGKGPVMGYTIKTKHYRYTAWGEEGEYGEELYDCQDDPEELKNLAGKPEYSEKQAKLKSLWKKTVERAKKAPKGVRQIHSVARRRVPR